MKNNSAKYTFYYLLSLVSLAIVSISFGMIIFEIIDKFIVDVAGYFYSSSIKGAISGLLIGAPIFFFSTSRIYKGLKEKELEESAPLRKWLTYLILFISSIVIIWALIDILNNFLEGGLTLNLGLKSLTILFISGVIFSFYLSDVRGSFKKLLKPYFVFSLSLILIVFVSSFFIIDSPQAAREKKLDEKIVSSAGTVESMISQYYYEYEKLPETLEEAREHSKYFIASEGIDYEVIDEDSYQLCATFLTSNLDEEERYFLWRHDKGYQCMTEKVNR